MNSRGCARNWTRRFLTGLAVSLALLAGGCGDNRFDASALYEGMDRSTIIAHFGKPDNRRSHDNAERLTYLDGEHYQYLLMLIDDKLTYWEHERVYKSNRFSSIRDWKPDGE